MKKIVASVGLVALGASGLHAASVPGFLTDPAKPWSVSATLRGFYDDNINSLPDDVVLPAGSEEDSWGYEISPAIMFNWRLPQTTLSLGYTYSYKYYENQPVFNDGHDDQSHTFNFGLNHQFNERFRVDARDSFVIGQEPDLLRAGNSFATFQRIPGDNLRNYGAIDFNGQLTSLLGFELGYGNAYYDYEADELSATLDRMEHNVHLDSRWQLQPQTVGVLGYNYREFDYTADEVIGFAGPAFDPVFSDARNLRSHIIYGGVDHNFRQDFSGSLRAGAQFTDYYNDSSIDEEVSPYVKASLRYAYMPESFAELGFTYDRNATDLVGADAEGFTADAETAVVYLNLRHRIAPNLFGSVQGQYQNSVYNGGAFDDDSENFYLIGLNLEYQFNRYFSAHVGYNYDNLDSNLDPGDRSFDRNRVYFGVTASY